jgi:hypothetical protein
MRYTYKPINNNGAEIIVRRFLALHADDDGVVESFPVMRTTGAAQDDLKILLAKKFIRQLNDDLVVFVTDWREHNFI